MRELNEEEIIDMLIEIKNHQVAFFEPKEHKQILKNYFTQEQRDAIQGLLDLYQAEKEKNFKRSDMIFVLKAENTKLKDEVKTLENADFTTVYMNGFFDGEKKWKDKIKERYEKLKHYDYIEIKELLKLLEGE